jgi:Xaa-Pro aminopeptidase
VREDDWLAFETITFAPFDTRLVDTSIMSQAEIDWLNDYHQQVHTKLAPILEADDLHWLERSTQQVA